MRHTIFASNWCFGLIKQHFYHTKIRDLDDIANYIILSLVNVPQLFGSLDGITFVSIYNWIQHFEEWRIKTALKGIKNMQYFRFVASLPGAVFVKSVSLAAAQKISLLHDTSWEPSSHQLPPVLVPMGHSAE